MDTTPRFAAWNECIELTFCRKVRAAQDCASTLILMSAGLAGGNMNFQFRCRDRAEDHDPVLAGHGRFSFFQTIKG
jgi:hypothetical protein